ncbi:DUF551 domain-containing protein [Escherichia coli]|nr:DUF551 domain-containing protein [Escherichia coli]EIA8219199.1 DUF551 domain-containing protein [Escherichia coli]EJH3463348.1 DUF551 domain-containing protein [Escherichia coli]EKA5850630.1 DUF551 domain-containing protein [Escherichia coli]
MTTITRENAEIKSFITGFLSDPAHDNQSSNSLLTNVFRIALASLEAEPVVYMWDSERKDIDAPGYYRTEHLVFAESSVKQWGGRVVPLYTAPPAPVALAVLERLQSIVADPRALPRRKEWVSGQQYSYVLLENVEAMVDEACRTAMIHAGNFREIPETSTNSPVTPTLLPGGFTVEDAKELHENLVRSHISQALSGEKMKKKDRDADLRWIHGVIVQAAWFVKASLEQNALSGNYPVTPGGWISCSERMPDDGQYVIILCDGAFVLYAQYRDGEFFDVVRNGEEFFETQSRNVTDWMPLPEPLQEVNQ